MKEKTEKGGIKMNIFKDRPVFLTSAWRPFFWVFSFLALCSFGAGLIGFWEARKAGLIGALLLIPVVVIIIFYPFFSSKKQE